MALDKATLKTDIETLINKMLSAPNLDPAGRATAISSYASDMADAIDKFVKTGTTSVEGEGIL